MGLRADLRLPKEHGAWGMLYVPLLLGAMVAPTGAGRVALFAASATLLFIGRESLLSWWRARSRGRPSGSALRVALLYLGLSVAAAAPLVLREGLSGLIPLGLLAGGLLVWNARQAARREERTVLTELVGIAGLTLTAPAASYVASGRWTSLAWWLWALSALYFAGSVFYVRLRVLTAHPKRPRELARIRRWCALYHGGLALGLAAAIVAGVLPALVFLAYVPVLARALHHLVRPAPELVLRRVGVLEILYSVIFLALAALAFRAGNQ